ncbi:hypothetical protein Tco_1367729 [Tanacetum coccineum]
MENTCSRKENSNSKTASNKSVKENNLDYATKDAFWVINRQFQKFVDSKFTLDYDSQMSDKYFAEYTGIEVKQFRETLLQHMSNVKKFVAERTRHQRQYDRRVVYKTVANAIKTTFITVTTVYVDLVFYRKLIGPPELEVQDDNSRSGNDTDVDDANIRPIYDEEPMDKVQLTTECNIFAIGQQHIITPPDGAWTDFSLVRGRGTSSYFDTRHHEHDHYWLDL